MASIVQDLTGEKIDGKATQEGSAALDTAIAPYVHPDVPVGKVQGVRATKACNWIEREETLTELLVAVLSTDSVGKLSCRILRDQREKAFLAKEAHRRPIVCCATLRFNPAVHAIHEIIEDLQPGKSLVTTFFDRYSYD